MWDPSFMFKSWGVGGWWVVVAYRILASDQALGHCHWIWAWVSLSKSLREPECLSRAWAWQQCSDHLLFHYKVTISFSLFRSKKKLFPYLMLERMTKCVPTVTKSLNIPHTWGSIFQLTLEKSPTFVQTVVEVSQDAAVSISTKESHVQNKQ